MRLVNIFTVSLLCLFFPQAAAAEDKQNERFQIVESTVIVDSETGLMWALQDNGKDIDWWEAKTFCENFTAGGYSDWRLPDIEELAALYTSGKSNRDGYFIAEPFDISECCMWSSYDLMGGALIFDFKTGKNAPLSLAETSQLRALPVRDANKTKQGK